MKKPQITVQPTDVLAWLKANYPELHAKAEPDRAWIWLPVDLRGEKNKPVRQSLVQFGFRFAKRGHPLPSGRIGTWAHHGVKPMPYKRRAGPKDGEGESAAGENRNAVVDSNLGSEIDSALKELGIEV